MSKLQDMEGRCCRLAVRNAELRDTARRIIASNRRLATENADLRDSERRLKAENISMYNAINKAYRAMNIMLRKNATDPEIEEVAAAFLAVTAFVGNIETESPTKTEDHGTI